LQNITFQFVHIFESQTVLNVLKAHIQFTLIFTKFK